MDHISGFFSRYLSPFIKQERMKEEVARVFSEVIGITISPKDVTIRSGVCSVAGHHSLQHQIFLHKDEILRRFKEIKELSHISLPH